MELRHLRYFLAVAESLHFGRAAQQLRIAQPSLSHQIRQLESELHTQLFDRSKKRVTLTQSGQLFLEESRLILEHADRAALAARTGKRRETGQVRVGFDYWIDWTKLGEAVRRFDKAHPTVHVQLFSMSSAQQIASLREARIVSAHPLRIQDSQVKTCWRNPLCWHWPKITDSRRINESH
jgi:DNA-binding transcriptional LysR family regulator